MAVHQIKKGLDLPISGEPRQVIELARSGTRVALLAGDYPGMRPTMAVQVGDAVRRGQLLFDDKKMPGVRYTAPAAGKVVAIHRGERRAFQSIVIEMSESERAGRPGDEEFQIFQAHTGKPIDALSRDEVEALLIESGVWTALRARPYGRTAEPGSTPQSLFVNVMDTNPLSADPMVVLKGREADFQAGLRVLAKLPAKTLFVCKKAGDALSVPSLPNLRVEEFAGPHPAGNVGTHIHLLDPVGRGRVNWYINYQDVIQVGRLFNTGRLDVERIVAWAGPTVRKPRLLQTRIGACLDEIVAGETEAVENRMISGSVLSGRTAMGPVHGYLGRYHLQVSALREGREREFMNWVMPGFNKYSTIRAYLGSLLGGKKWAMTTSKNGSDRAIVPIGMYERVMPLDIQPTYLLRSLCVKDVEKAEQLGILELEEEDLALCTFVCPGKIDYGPLLRENLNILEKEG